jgi:hypothetical protein
MLQNLDKTQIEGLKKMQKCPKMSKNLKKWKIFQNLGNS